MIIADLNALPPKARKTGAATIVGMAREMEAVHGFKVKAR